MRLICKDTNKGSITFFTKGKYAFRGVDRNDTTDDVPDPILDVNNYNESIQFYSKTQECVRSIGVTGIKSNFLS
jgi:hypothetical protein